jgi:hypothetical protein
LIWISAVASQSVNDVFSATYTNYRIVLNAVGNGNTNIGILMRLRVSGADNSTANYDRNLLSLATTQVYSYTGSQTSFLIGPQSTTDSGISLDIYNPEKAARTSFTGLSYYNANAEMDVNGGIFNLTTQFTGFTLIPLGGVSPVITGEVSVYGYNK